MIILGIDPGLAKTGWGVISCQQNNIHFVACGNIASPNNAPLAERIKFLYENILQILELYQPSEVAIEETFINVNPASSLKLGHARGALMLAVALRKIPLFEYSTTSVKKTVSGVGRADKAQIGAMIKYLLPKAIVKSEDEADALAVAICHNNHRSFYSRR